MNWHNFKVMSLYGAILGVFLFLFGKGAIGICAFVGFSLYGLIDCVKQYCKIKKLNKGLENVPEQIREIVICHIVKRHPKLKKRVIQRIKKDIIDGNYQIESFCLTEMKAVTGNEPDAGARHLLIFDNKAHYDVYSFVYDNANVGDTLWVVSTPTDKLKVIQSKTDYFNMLSPFDMI